MRAGEGAEEEEPEPEPEPAGPVVDCGEGREDGVGGAGVQQIRFIAPPPGFDYEGISWSEIWYETVHFLIQNFSQNHELLPRQAWDECKRKQLRKSFVSMVVRTGC